MKKLLIFLALPFFLVGCQATKKEISGKLFTSDPLVWDFGTIDIDTPFIEKEFTFTNTEKDPLEILGGNSSCGCTAATINVNGKSSPLFSMNSPLRETFTIPAETDFKVMVRYEPGYHGPDATGERNQLVYFISSSIQNPTTPTRLYPLDGKSALTEIKLMGNITSSKETN